MFKNWSVKSHTKVFREATGKVVTSEGFLVTRSFGEHKQYVFMTLDMEITENQQVAMLFKSKDQAELIADKFNTLERKKKEWIRDSQSL